MSCENRVARTLWQRGKAMCLRFGWRAMPRHLRDCNAYQQMLTSIQVSGITTKICEGLVLRGSNSTMQGVYNAALIKIQNL
jgi:hypothetical protein